MKLFLRIVLLIALVSGTLTQEFDLADAFDDVAPVTTPKSKPDTPKVEGGGGGFDGFDLSDALKPDPQPKQPDNKPKSGGGSEDLDLFDALGPDPEPKPDKPAVNPNSGGGGGTLSDDDLFDITGGGGGSYKPEGGRPGGGGQDPGYDPHGNADQPQAEAGSGQIAGIVSAVGVALMGAASSYIAYQKKKLCFKMQGGVDPEKGQRGTHTEPQVLSNLLQSN